MSANSRLTNAYCIAARYSLEAGTGTTSAASASFSPDRNHTSGVFCIMADFDQTSGSSTSARKWGFAVFLGALFLVHAPTAIAQSPTIGGCPVFPPDNIWNTPIDQLPVDSRSRDYVASIGADVHLHPDFGAGLYEGAPMGIPYVLVPMNQPKVAIHFRKFDDEQPAGEESDAGPYPIPRNAPIEGGPNSHDDRHVLVVQQGSCTLFELYKAVPNRDGSWNAVSAARFDLESHELRIDGHTSADAAGLPILPGLVRYEEVAAGRDPPCLALHGAPHAEGLCLACTSFRLREHGRRPTATWPALPPARRFRRVRLLPCEPGDPARPSDLRNDPRRQRVALVPQRRAASRLEQRPAARVAPGQGLGLRGGRHLVAHARPQFRSSRQLNWPCMRVVTAYAIAMSAALSVHLAYPWDAAGPFRSGAS